MNEFTDDFERRIPDETPPEQKKRLRTGSTSSSAKKWGNLCLV
jgi:hypothetical protein